MSSRSTHLLAALTLLSLSVACGGSGSKREQGLGEGYVGPIDLKIRAELGPRADIAGTATHGERIEVLQRRRRFLRIRTENGVEGWVDGRQILDEHQMRELHQLAERCASLPSMGTATVYSPLNIHTEAHRLAPSFYQIQEGGSVEVIGHMLVERGPYDRLNTLIQPPPPPPKPVKAKKPAKKEKIPPPPMPPAPPVPDNWLELSRRNMPEEKVEPENESAVQRILQARRRPQQQVQQDDWSLVRTESGQAGWVLTRQLVMAIPDEVAQYAEGHRITSYFPLGTVQAGDETKHHWLWTTLSSGLKDYQFDGFRVFIWNARRHRYETAYIERNVKGYYPVLTHEVTVTEGRTTQTVPGFTLIVEDKEGNVFKRTFAFQGYRVRQVAKEPAERPPAPGFLDAAEPNRMLAEENLRTLDPSLIERWKNRTVEWRKRLIGR
ncbi:MAG: SH3 domain-containing protein [Bryobacteraceae bacterium]